MVALKAQQINAFVAKPDKAVRCVLLYGPDSGLVTERAQKIAAAMAARENPPGEVVRIEEADLDGDPERLSVELLTVPMFGGAKIVRTSTGRRINVVALQPIVEGPALPGGLVVEAGDLKRDDKIRVLFERLPSVAAIPCYADEGRSLSDLVTEVLTAGGLGITSDARALLVGRLGADRALSRSEVEKLALYAAGDREVDVSHVEAIVGDASELAIDRIVSAAAEGRVDAALRECDRAVSSGESPQTILLFTLKHFQRLHRFRAGMDAGRSLDGLLQQTRPPVHFRVKEQIERQTRLWSSQRLGLALARISEAAKAARLGGDLEKAIAERLLVALAKLAQQGMSAGGSPR